MITDNSPSIPFWRQKTLAQMSEQEWESLCDGCGKCCLNKLIDDDTDELYYTSACCKLLDRHTGQCSDYLRRFKQVPDCVKVSLDDSDGFGWLPPTCAYRRLNEGRDLPNWHPLLTGSTTAMHQAGQSVRGKVVDERTVDDLQDYIVIWPLIDDE